MAIMDIVYKPEVYFGICDSQLNKPKILSAERSCQLLMSLLPWGCRDKYYWFVIEIDSLILARMLLTYFFKTDKNAFQMSSIDFSSILRVICLGNFLVASPVTLEMHAFHFTPIESI